MDRGSPPPCRGAKDQPRRDWVAQKPNTAASLHPSLRTFPTRPCQPSRSKDVRCRGFVHVQLDRRHRGERQSGIRRSNNGSVLLLNMKTTYTDIFLIGSFSVQQKFMQCSVPRRDVRSICSPEKHKFYIARGNLSSYNSHTGTGFTCGRDTHSAPRLVCDG